MKRFILFLAVFAFAVIGLAFAAPPDSCGGHSAAAAKASVLKDNLTVKTETANVVRSTRAETRAASTDLPAHKLEAFAVKTRDRIVNVDRAVYPPEIRFAEKPPKPEIIKIIAGKRPTTRANGFRGLGADTFARARV